MGWVDRIERQKESGRCPHLQLCVCVRVCACVCVCACPSKLHDDSSVLCESSGLLGRGLLECDISSPSVRTGETLLLTLREPSSRKRMRMTTDCRLPNAVSRQYRKFLDSLKASQFPMSAKSWGMSSSSHTCVSTYKDAVSSE